MHVEGTKAVVLAAMLAVAGGAPVFAHHSISAHYHRGETQTLEGVIATVFFQNPHASIHLDVASDAGTERWTLEWDDTDDLREAGFTADTLKSGDRVIVAGNPSRDGSNRVFIRNLERPADGLEYVDD
jgi:hypothetical protein